MLAIYQSSDAVEGSECYQMNVVRLHAHHSGAPLAAVKVDGKCGVGEVG